MDLRKAFICCGSKISIRPTAIEDIDRFESWWKEADANYLDSGHHIGPPASFGDKLRERWREHGYLRSWYTIVTTEGEVVGYIRYIGIDL
ncbi:MAG TPA: hypothetical protein DCM14_02565, partial [Clostridiales bacterium UBA8153]|nr:hypothetical protein [Clostridiales bacterium UBA8153]